MSTPGSLVLFFLKHHTVQIETTVWYFIYIFKSTLYAYDFQDNFYWVTKSLKNWIPSDIQNIELRFAIQVNNKYYKTYYLSKFGAVRIDMGLVPPRFFPNAYQYYYHPTFYIFIKMLRFSVMRTVDNNFYIHHLQVMQTMLHSHISYNGVVKFLKSLLKDCKNDF